MGTTLSCLTRMACPDMLTRPRKKADEDISVFIRFFLRPALATQRSLSIIPSLGRSFVGAVLLAAIMRMLGVVHHRSQK